MFVLLTLFATAALVSGYILGSIDAAVFRRVIYAPGDPSQLGRKRGILCRLRLCTLFVTPREIRPIVVVDASRRTIETGFSPSTVRKCRTCGACLVHVTGVWDG